MRYDATLSRVGVFPYRLPDGTVRLEYRPPDEVGRADSLESLELAPVVEGHPGKPGMARKLAAGAVGAVKFDGAHVTGSIVIYDDALNARISRGDIRELSPGYSVRLDETPGVSPEGERYDAIQRDIVYDHEALVPRGRQGSSVAVHTDEADVGWRADAAVGLSTWGVATASVVSSSLSFDALRDLVARAVQAEGLTIRQDAAGRADAAAYEVSPGWVSSDGRAHVQVSSTDVSQDDLVAKLKSGLASIDAQVSPVTSLPAAPAAPPRMDRADAVMEPVMKELQEKLAAALADLAAATARADAAEAKAKTETARADKAEGERDAAVVRADKAEQARADAAAAAPAVVRARIRLEDTAVKILGAEFKVDGVSDVEIQRAVVAKLTGKPLPEGKGAEYVAARYDAALEDAAAATADSAKLRETVTPVPAAGAGQRADGNQANAAREAMLNRNMTAGDKPLTTGSN